MVKLERDERMKLEVTITGSWVIAPATIQYCGHYE